MSITLLLPILKEFGSFTAFLIVILFVGQRLINCLVSNITTEMRSGFNSICDRLDSLIGNREMNTTTIIAAIEAAKDVIVGHLMKEKDN